MLHLQSRTPCPLPGKLIVDTHADLDTGGPEAMVQLLLAIHDICPNKTFANDDRAIARGTMAADLVAPRFAHEYPKLREVPLMKFTGLGAGDAFIVPEHRTACGPYHRSLLRNGTAAFVMLLSSRETNQVGTWLRSGCRIMYHSYWVSTLGARDLHHQRTVVS